MFVNGTDYIVVTLDKSEINVIAESLELNYYESGQSEEVASLFAQFEKIRKLLGEKSS